MGSRDPSPEPLTGADPWRYDTASDLDQTALERLRRFPREPDMFVYALRTIAAVFLRAWLRLYHRLVIVGRERLPREGSYVLVANHASHLDALTLVTAHPLAKIHRVFPAAAADYFFTSVSRLAFSAIVVNALPFQREVHVRQSLALCRALLENPGNVLVIFPEGTRSRTGEMGEFKAGLGLLVAGTPHPVVPCRLEGTFAAWPKGRWFPRPRRVRLTIGEPRTYAEHARGKDAALFIASDLRAAISSLASPSR
jgi:1-acyl-sn-glycerol-3-phosphate acyltransferase